MLISFTLPQPVDPCSLYCKYCCNRVMPTQDVPFSNLTFGMLWKKQLPPLAQCHHQCLHYRGIRSCVSSRVYIVYNYWCATDYFKLKWRDDENTGTRLKSSFMTLTIVLLATVWAMMNKCFQHLTQRDWGCVGKWHRFGDKAKIANQCSAVLLTTTSPIACTSTHVLETRLLARVTQTHFSGNRLT